LNRSRWLALLAVLTTALGAIYTFRIAPRWLRVERLRVALPGLPDAWRGVRIAHLSDLHAGARGVPLPMLLEARQAALEFEPDIVALTGDYFHDGRRVSAPGLYASWPDSAQVFAVLGNHDYRAGAAGLAEVERELADGGACLLRNTAHEFELRGRSAWVVGVDDPFTFRADERLAFQHLPPEAEALLFLAHSPAGVDELPVGRARVTLSGHTHGGQLRLLPSGRTPGVGLLRRLLGAGPRRESTLYRGRHWRRGTLLIISDGLGMSQLPGRFRTRPTVLLLTLDNAPASGVACDDATRYVTVENPPRWWARWLT
jgi:predicted MPP superfamily phosphohydrolase